MATFVIARLTFLEAARRKIALAALVLGLAFLVIYNVGFYFMQHDLMTNANQGRPIEVGVQRTIFNFLTLAGLYAINFLTLAMGALLSADTLAGEIGSGTIQCLVSKPIRRAEIVLGKWLGFAVMLALYLLGMAGGVVASVWVQVRYQLPNLLPGLGVLALVSFVCNSSLVALMVSLEQGGNFFAVWRARFVWPASNYVTAAAVAGLLARTEGAITGLLVVTIVVTVAAIWVSSRGQAESLAAEEAAPQAW